MGPQLPGSIHENLVQLQDRKETFVIIFNQYRDKILRLCYSYLDDRSFLEDIFQDILTAIWVGLPGFREESGYGTWVYRITVNTIFLFNRRERKTRNEKITDQMIDRSVAELEQKIHQEKNLERLYQEVSKLEELDRIIMGLYLEGQKYEAIGKILGLSSGHVGVKINRIKEKIRKQLSI
jgi:RNA polymerase sigma-70 factor (ECF subfamily)